MFKEGKKLILQKYSFIVTKLATDLEAKNSKLVSKMVTKIRD